MNQNPPKGPTTFGTIVVTLAVVIIAGIAIWCFASCGPAYRTL